MSFEGHVAAAAVGRARPAGRSRASAWLLAALMGLAAIVQQSLVGLGADVSWLLTVGERVMDGQRLYVDVFEVNPPASVLIYLPAIAAARLFAVSAEFGTSVLVFTLAAISIWGAGRLLADAGILRRERRGPIAALATLAFVLLPGACFAQREHVALLTVLPFMALVAARSRGRSAGLAAALLAGFGAGITMAIKPHFALAVAPMVLFAMTRRRSVSLADGVEIWAAAAVLLSYGLLVVGLYPAYLSDALPLLNAVYLPARTGYGEMLQSPHMILFIVACALAAFAGRGRLVRNLSILPLLAAIGFAAALIVQGKGYLNHAYPAVALALVALGVAVIDREANGARRAVGAAAFLLLAGLSLYVFTHVASYGDLARSVQRVAPPNPRIIVAGSNLSVGHPLTRWLDGTWAGRRGSLWATGTAVEVLADSADQRQRALIAAYIEEDRRIFVEDIAIGRPDVVLVPGQHGLQWIASHRDVASALKPYRRAGAAQDVHILVRRPAT
jgi:hypothetical protein